MRKFIAPRGQRTTPCHLLERETRTDAKLAAVSTTSLAISGESLAGDLTLASARSRGAQLGIRLFLVRRKTRYG